LEEKLDSVVIKGLEENSPFLNPHKQEKSCLNSKTSLKSNFDPDVKLVFLAIPLQMHW
jgi:hypothetical protein